MTLPLALTHWLQQQGFDSTDLNSCIDNSMTPLMVAAKEGNSTIVDALLAAGADVNRVNADGNAALWFACFSQVTAIIASLIQKGAYLNHANASGSTCLMYAASAGRLQAVQLLVEAGADLNAHNPDGFTALDFASTLAILKYLRAYYAKFNH